MSKHNRKRYQNMLPFFEALKASFNHACEWRYVFSFIFLSYISDLPVWEKIGVYSYLDAAFLLSQKILPAWIPFVWGNILDHLYGTPFGVTSIIFLTCQLVSYTLKKIWQYKWLYTSISLSFIVILHDFIRIYFYSEKISLQSSLRGMIVSIIFLFIIEPFLTDKIRKKPNKVIKQSKTIKKINKNYKKKAS